MVNAAGVKPGAAILCAMNQSSEKTALVTGGTGFVGRAVVDELLADGWQVAVLTRDATAARRMLPVTVTCHESLDDCPPPAAVINLAGENLGAKRWNAARKQAFVDSRVGMTRALVDAMAGCEYRPEVLVNGSAVGFYGACGDKPIDEQRPAGDEYQSRLCQAWEAEARRASDLGVRVAVVRIGAVLGVRQGALSELVPPFRFGLGGPQGSGRQWLSWIHRQDLARAILFLVNNPDCDGVYNATAPYPVRNREFARALGRVLRRPTLLPLPSPMLRLIAGEMAHLVLTGQKVLPARLQAAGFEFRYPDLEPALREILARW